MKRIVIVLLFITGLSLRGFAQEWGPFDGGLDSGYAITIRGHAGFLISHRESMSHLVQGHIGGYEINFDKQTSGNQSWHNQFKRPFVGVGLMQLWLGNPEQLGTATSVFGYLDFPLIKREKFIFHYKWSGGLGWVSKPFNRIENYKNTAIGSKLNMTASVLLETRYRIGERMWLTSGFGFQECVYFAYCPLIFFGIQCSAYSQ